MVGGIHPLWQENQMAACHLHAEGDVGIFYRQPSDACEDLMAFIRTTDRVSEVVIVLANPTAAPVKVGHVRSAGGRGFKRAPEEFETRPVRKCLIFLDVYFMRLPIFLGMDMKISFQKDQTSVNELPSESIRCKYILYKVNFQSLTSKSNWKWYFMNIIQSKLVISN